MPLYEYRCAKCGKVFELIQKFSDAPLETHEGCGGSVEKLISRSALQFKGSGWYVNDYPHGGSSGAKSEGKTEAAEKKSDSAAGSDSKADTKTAAKPESKSESKPAAPAKTDS